MPGGRHGGVARYRARDSSSASQVAEEARVVGEPFEAFERHVLQQQPRILRALPQCPRRVASRSHLLRGSTPSANRARGPSDAAAALGGYETTHQRLAAFELPAHTVIAVPSAMGERATHWSLRSTVSLRGPKPQSSCSSPKLQERWRSLLARSHSLQRLHGSTLDSLRYRGRLIPGRDGGRVWACPHSPRSCVGCRGNKRDQAAAER